MYYKSKLSLIVLTSLISSSAFAGESSSFIATAVNTWNDAACFIDVACKGKCEMRSHFTEQYVACSIAHTLKEEPGREKLIEVANDILAHTVKHWRKVEDLHGSCEREVGKSFGEVKAPYIISFVFNRNNVYVRYIKEKEHTIRTYSQCYKLRSKHKVSVIQCLSGGSYGIIGFGKDSLAVVEASQRSLAQRLLEGALDKGGPIIVIDRQKLFERLQQLPEQHQDSEECA